MKIRLKPDVNPEIASVLREILPTSKGRHEDHQGDRKASRERVQLHNQKIEPYPYKLSQFQDVKKKEPVLITPGPSVPNNKPRPYQPTSERYAQANNASPAFVIGGNKTKDQPQMYAENIVPTFQINLVKEPNFFIREVESLNYEEKFETEENSDEKDQFPDLDNTFNQRSTSSVTEMNFKTLCSNNKSLSPPEEELRTHGGQTHPELDSLNDRGSMVRLSTLDYTGLKSWEPAGDDEQGSSYINVKRNLLSDLRKEREEAPLPRHIQIDLAIPKSSSVFSGAKPESKISESNTAAFSSVDIEKDLSANNMNKVLCQLNVEKSLAERICNHERLNNEKRNWDEKQKIGKEEINPNVSSTKPEVFKPLKEGEGQLVVKKLAAEKSKLLEKRKMSTIRIQKIARGFLARRKFKKLKEESKGTNRKFLDHQDRQAGKEIESKDEIVLRFVNHCATYIQKIFRGYNWRKKHREAMSKLRRLKTLVTTMINGWRIRKILKLPKSTKLIDEILDLTILVEDLQLNARPATKVLRDQTMEKLKSRKREFCNRIEHLSETRNWLKDESFSIQKSPLSTPKIREGVKEDAIKSCEGSSSNRKINRKSKLEMIGRNDLNKNTGSLNNFNEEEDSDSESSVVDEKNDEINQLKKIDIKSRPLPGINRQSNTAKSPENSRNFIKNLTPPRGSFNNEEPPASNNATNKNYNFASKKAVALKQQSSDVGGEEDNFIESELSSKKEVKKDFLKKRTKYDPRKAVEEERKRKKDQEDKELLEREQRAKSRGRTETQTTRPSTSEDPSILSAERSSNGNRSFKEEIGREDDEDQPKAFLKRKSKKIEFQKLNWKKVTSRIDCGNNRGSPKKNPPSLLTYTSNQTQRSAEGSLSPIRKKLQEYKDKPETRIKPKQSRSTSNIIHEAMEEQEAEEQRFISGQESSENMRKKVISIEELEKAYKNNYCPKLLAIRKSMHMIFAHDKMITRSNPESGRSMIPVISEKSPFNKNYSTAIFNEMEEQYKTLQQNNS